MTGGTVRQEQPVVPAKLPMPYNRCDQCGHRAWVRVWVNADALSVIDLCGHHYHEHETRLIAMGAVVEDFRDKILETTDGA